MHGMRQHNAYKATREHTHGSGARMSSMLSLTKGLGDLWEQKPSEQRSVGNPSVHDPAGALLSALHGNISDHYHGRKHMVILNSIC